MLLERSTSTLSELRQDFEGSNQGKVRLGLTVIVATAAVTASGWPPGDVLQRTLFLIIGVLPAACVGAGLIVGELLQARADRRGEERADDREVRAIRARISEEAGRPWRWWTADEAAPTGPATYRVVAPPPVPPPQPQRTPPGRSLPAPRRLVAARGRVAPFRSGYLRLR